MIQLWKSTLEWKEKNWNHSGDKMKAQRIWPVQPVHVWARWWSPSVHSVAVLFSPGLPSKRDAAEGWRCFPAQHWRSRSSRPEKEDQAVLSWFHDLFCQEKKSVSMAEYKGEISKVYFTPGGKAKGLSPKLKCISAFFSTTAGKKGVFRNWLFNVKATPKSLLFFRHRTSPLSKSKQHPITSDFPYGYDEKGHRIPWRSEFRDWFRESTEKCPGILRQRSRIVCWKTFCPFRQIHSRTDRCPGREPPERWTILKKPFHWKTSAISRDNGELKELF